MSTEQALARTRARDRRRPDSYSTPGWTPELRDQVRQRFTTHGMTSHPLYVTWRGMTGRCHNPGHRAYRWYGARGIEVCGEWRSDPAAFIAWIEANLGPRPDGMTLDRIDNDLGYAPGNLKWSTRAEQLANRRATAKQRADGPESPG